MRTLAISETTSNYHSVPLCLSIRWLRERGNLGCTVPATPFIYSFSGNSAASALISTFMCLWAIYIFPGSVHIHISSSRKGRPIVGIYNSLTDTWMWKLGLRPRYSFSGNIYFKFSVFFLCSVGVLLCLCVSGASFLFVHNIPIARRPVLYSSSILCGPLPTKPMYFVSCRLFPSPPSHHGSVWLLYLSSLYS